MTVGGHGRLLDRKQGPLRALFLPLPSPPLDQRRQRLMVLRETTGVGLVSQHRNRARARRHSGVRWKPASSGATVRRR
jgi:hypothetical protein